MRPSLFSLLAAASTVSAIGIDCANHNVKDLIRRTACGSSEEISRCIEQVEGFRLEEISPCFISSGCEKDDAVWFMQECNMPDSKQDLRKRATSTDKDTATDKTTAKSSATSKATSTTAPSSTAASTTKDSSTSPTATSTTVTTASSASSTSTSSGSTASSSMTGSSSSSLVCSTTKFITTSACSTSGSSKTCSATTMTTATCASGLLCFPTMGANVCMKRDVPLTTSGIIVSIGFGIAVTGVIVGLIIMSVKARTKSAADKRERELMLAGVGKKSAMDDVESVPYKIGGGGVSESNLPLVTPGGPRSDQMQYQQEYNSQAVPQIQLHPGVGALEQEESPHWGQDYNARR